MRFPAKKYPKYEWHRWFAWHPVRLGQWRDGELVWLETVERVWISGDGWYYRIPGTDIGKNP